MAGSDSASAVRCVATRGALTANTKPSGTSPRHLAKLAGVCVR